MRKDPCAFALSRALAASRLTRRSSRRLAEGTSPLALTIACPQAVAHARLEAQLVTSPTPKNRGWCRPDLAMHDLISL
eukprot:2956725-Pleurochrysis_carterae.AAC.2